MHQESFVAFSKVNNMLLGFNMYRKIDLLGEVVKISLWVTLTKEVYFSMDDH